MKLPLSRLFTLIFALLSLLLYGFIYQRESKPVLRIFTWSSFFDPKVIKEFEKEHNCQVEFDIFDSNELMYAKLKSANVKYDLLTPSLYIGKLLSEQGMIEPLDWSKLPHLKTLDLDYCQKEELEPYFAPYLMTFSGIGYVKSRVRVDQKSWSLLAREDLRYRTTLLNDFRETLGVGLLYLGYDLNHPTKDQLIEATNLLRNWKKNIAKLENEQYKLGLDSAEFLAVHAYSGEIAQLIDINDDIGFFLPKEGFTLSMDVFCISQKSNSKDLAYAFIDFMHRPSIAARNIEHTHYLCPNSSCYRLLSERTRGNRAIFIDSHEIKRAHKLEVSPENGWFLQAWDKFKAP